MFIFTTAKIWNQPKRPLADEWIKMWYVYTMEYHSAIKKNDIMPCAVTWMQTEIIIPSEVKGKRKTAYDMAFMRNLKYDTNESIYATGLRI